MSVNVMWGVVLLAAGGEFVRWGSVQLRVGQDKQQGAMKVHIGTMMHKALNGQSGADMWATH
ncbi:hypothetical protein ACFWNT_27410 [Streptomyces sp. NPDC058409]|uniref:hypothetical protein n=1 Tax=Streptomyces sp. NPDC058409 TaxID=3346484 RepID=UPI00364BDC38